MQADGVLKVIVRKLRCMRIKKYAVLDFMVAETKKEVTAITVTS
jgi:hypothetical protein